MNHAVAIIVMRLDRVLLVRSRKRHGSVELPGGAILPGETVHAAAVRELHEECGLVANPKHGWVVGCKQNGWDVFFANVECWAGVPRPGGDVTECWFGDPYWLREGYHPEDHDAVLRVYDRQRAGVCP